MTINFSNFHNALANLRFSDRDLLRTAGFAKLSKVYEAYPTLHDGERLCILLPHGLTPKEAAAFDDMVATSKKVIILKQDHGRWTKYWPGGAAATASVPTSEAHESNANSEQEGPLADIEIVEE